MCVCVVQVGEQRHLQGGGGYLSHQSPPTASRLPPHQMWYEQEGGAGTSHRLGGSYPYSGGPHAAPSGLGYLEPISGHEAEWQVPIHETVYPCEYAWAGYEYAWPGHERTPHQMARSHERTPHQTARSHGVTPQQKAGPYVYNQPNAHRRRQTVSDPGRRSPHASPQVQVLKQKPSTGVLRA